MRAARLYGVEDLRVEEVADPRPGPGEAVVRIEACGVCPSDLRRFTGTGHVGGQLPMTPGHEWAGVVVEVGPATDAPVTFKPGDRVVADWRYICGQCYECRRGAMNYCQRLQRRVRGGFAELGVAPFEQLRLVPETYPSKPPRFASRWRAS